MNKQPAPRRSGRRSKVKDERPNMSGCEASAEEETGETEEQEPAKEKCEEEMKKQPAPRRSGRRGKVKDERPNTKEKCDKEEEMKKQPERGRKRRHSNDDDRPIMSGCEASAEEKTGETEEQEPAPPAGVPQLRKAPVPINPPPLPKAPVPINPPPPAQAPVPINPPPLRRVPVRINPPPSPQAPVPVNPTPSLGCRRLCRVAPQAPVPVNPTPLSGGNADSELRMILIGKTGTGMSASGNTILGSKQFISETSSSSITKECVKIKGGVDGRSVAVVDTPGLYDTELSETESLREIGKCISMSSPGPHAFLIVLQVGRFTEEERDTVDLIIKAFGEGAEKYTLVLFTRKDELEDETIEEYIKRGDPHLKKIVEKCGGRCHSFNNKMMSDRSQVTELLGKIDKMVANNRGSCYTNEIYKKAEAAIEEEKKRIMKENPGYSVEDARKKAEGSNAFIRQLIGAVLGAIIGAFGGPIGAAVGAGIGAFGGPIGAVVGAGIGAAAGGGIVAVVNDKCSIQ